MELAEIFCGLVSLFIVKGSMYLILFVDIALGWVWCPVILTQNQSLDPAVAQTITFAVAVATICAGGLLGLLCLLIVLSTCCCGNMQIRFNMRLMIILCGWLFTIIVVAYCVIIKNWVAVGLLPVYRIVAMWVPYTMGKIEDYQPV